MTETLIVTTFADSNDSLLSVLDENSIKYNRIFKLSAEPMAAGITIEIIINGGWGVLAVAFLAWAHVRKSRRINITTKNNESIRLEGYSVKDAETILESAKNVALIDTNNENKKGEGMFIKRTNGRGVIFASDLTPGQAFKDTIENGDSVVLHVGNESVLVNNISILSNNKIRGTVHGFEPSCGLEFNGIKLDDEIDFSEENVISCS